MIKLLLKHIKKLGFAIVLGVAFLITLVLYSQFSQTESFNDLIAWSQQNVIILIVLLALIKIIGIIWPPLPGMVFVVAAIPVIGWFPAFLIDFFGALLGATVAFNLSRKYGEVIVLKLFGKSGLKQVKRFKLNPKNEFEAIVLMRFFMGSISELISYGLGLTNMKFRNYFWGTFLSYLVVGVPLFYMLGLVLSTNNLLFSVIPLAVGIAIILILRNRYFSIEEIEKKI